MSLVRALLNNASRLLERTRRVTVQIIQQSESEEPWYVQLPDGTREGFTSRSKAQRVAIYAAAHHDADVREPVADRTFVVGVTIKPHAPD